MKLIVSYYTNNLWTTDYFLQNLKENWESYFYMRHPFHFEQDLKYSELVYYNASSKTDSIKLKFKKLQNIQLEILKNMIVNYIVSFYLISKIDSIYWFGSFNIFSFLWLRLVWKKTVFWWVDYSRKRFDNNLMNRIYLILESIACVFASKVISSSKRQEQARIKYHHLSKKKSTIINNGINEVDNVNYDFNAHTKNAFIYIWSITEQHWIINFIKTLYSDNSTNNNLYIFWWWEKEDELKRYLKLLDNKKIHYFWRKGHKEIKDFIEKSQEKLWWIAPYDDTINDHVYYWDSLKIREYLMYWIPFLTSNVVHIPDGLNRHWYKYQNKLDIQKYLDWKYVLKEKEIRLLLKKFHWVNLFKNIYN